MELGPAAVAGHWLGQADDHSVQDGLCLSNLDPPLGTNMAKRNKIDPASAKAVFDMEPTHMDKREVATHRWRKKS